MSYDVELRDKEANLCKVPRFDEGGIRIINLEDGSSGTEFAELNVTYNYTKFFNFRSLNGRKANDTIKELSVAVELLGTIQDENYWAKTSGNAGYACDILLGWARLHPEAIWDVN
ncbi:hypothetical protein M0R19_04945 [Candidatus Pacearchaeota archaeon]|jgi:hypothetical protein|nr:hypothetical protein [Candidatus Pacearchaeota archaeon]